jgi:hypothetical protein
LKLEIEGPNFSRKPVTANMIFTNWKIYDKQKRIH